MTARLFGCDPKALCGCDPKSMCQKMIWMAQLRFCSLEQKPNWKPKITSKCLILRFLMRGSVVYFCVCLGPKECLTSEKNKLEHCWFSMQTIQDDKIHNFWTWLLCSVSWKWAAVVQGCMYNWRLSSFWRGFPLKLVLCSGDKKNFSGFQVAEIKFWLGGGVVSIVPACTLCRNLCVHWHVVEKYVSQHVISTFVWNVSSLILHQNHMFCEDNHVGAN